MRAGERDCVSVGPHNGNVRSAAVLRADILGAVVTCQCCWTKMILLFGKTCYWCFVYWPWSCEVSSLPRIFSLTSRGKESERSLFVNSSIPSKNACCPKQNWCQFFSFFNKEKIALVSNTFRVCHRRPLSEGVLERLHDPVVELSLFRRRRRRRRRRIRRPLRD